MTESIYPENLLQAIGNCIPTIRGQWFILYTKPRQEQASLATCCGCRFRSISRGSRKSRCAGDGCSVRRRRCLPATFFCSAMNLKRSRCLATHRVVRVLPVFDQEKLHKDLLQLEQLIKTEMPLTVGTRSGPRDRIRVRRRHLQKLEESGPREKAEARVVVSVDVDRGGPPVVRVHGRGSSARHRSRLFGGRHSTRWRGPLGSADGAGRVFFLLGNGPPDALDFNIVEIKGCIALFGKELGVGLQPDVEASDARRPVVVCGS